MKWGTVYGPEYVNILYDMVRRHLKTPHRFLCLTDDTSGIRPEIETAPIPDIPLGSAPHFSGWRKLACLSPELDIQGTVLFFDLDVVILDELSPFLDFEAEKFCIIENWTQIGQGIGNSSVFRYEAGKHTDIFEHFRQNHEQIYIDVTNEQTYLTEMVRETGYAVKFWPEEWCRSFKRHSLPRNRLLRFVQTPRQPENCRVLVFHGPPKPIDAANGIWPQKWKTLRPAPWILKHWKEDKANAA